MASHSFQTIVLALSLLLSIVSCAPSRPSPIRDVPASLPTGSTTPIRPFLDNDAYALEYEVDETRNRWLFNVYADGYQKLNADGKPEAVDTVVINKQSKRLTVVKAMNGLDTTEPRLKMREVLRELWIRAGLEPSEIKEVLGFNIENDNMQQAIMQCRDGLGLEAIDNFVVTDAETEPARRDCWNTLGGTIFSASMMGAIKDFDIKKELVSIGIEHEGQVDHVYYNFS